MWQSIEPLLRRADQSSEKYSAFDPIRVLMEESKIFKTTQMLLQVSSTIVIINLQWVELTRGSFSYMILLVQDSPFGETCR